MQASGPLTPYEAEGLQHEIELSTGITVCVYEVKRKGYCLGLNSSGVFSLKWFLCNLSFNLSIPSLKKGIFMLVTLALFLKYLECCNQPLPSF